MSLKSEFEFGYVAKAHGIHGELVIKTHDRASDALDHIDTLRLKKGGVSKDYAIEQTRIGPSGHMLVMLEEVENRDSAENLVGSTCIALRDELPENSENEYFMGDLVGLKVKNREGREWGIVQGIYSHGPVPNVLILQDKEEHWLPFADDFIFEVCLEEGYLVADPLPQED